MRIDELEEWQGMTADMVREWLQGKGATHSQGYWRHSLGIYPDGSSGGLLWSDTLHALARDFCASRIQALLREINPRLRKGWPSDEAIAAAKKWVAKHPKGVIFVGEILDDPERGPGLAVSLTTRLDKNQLDGWSFWPCDEYGNKVRWPTDAEGNML